MACLSNGFILCFDREPEITTNHIAETFNLNHGQIVKGIDEIAPDFRFQSVPYFTKHTKYLNPFPRIAGLDEFYSMNFEGFMQLFVIGIIPMESFTKIVIANFISEKDAFLARQKLIRGKVCRLVAEMMFSLNPHTLGSKYLKEKEAIFEIVYHFKEADFRKNRDLGENDSLQEYNPRLYRQYEALAQIDVGMIKVGADFEKRVESLKSYRDTFFK